MVTTTSSSSSTETQTAPESVRNADVVVIGGGPCGSLAAILLHQRGVAVTLIERVPDFSNFDASRAYIQSIDYRGSGVLDSVPGLLEHVKNEGSYYYDLKIAAWTPEDKVQTATAPRIGPDGKPNVRMLRPGLLDGLKSFLLSNCDNVTSMYGTSVTNIHFEDDGSMELVLDTNGDEKRLRTRLVLACDGKNSIVKKALDMVDQSGATVAIKNSHGAGDTSFDSPAVGLMVKCIVLNETVTSYIDSKLPNGPDMGSVRVLRGQAKGRPTLSKFSIAMFPLIPKYVRLSGGIVGTIVARPDHDIWKLESVEDGYKLFEANHPQAVIRDYISVAQMDRFVSARPLTFPPISRRKSLVNHIGTSALGGVVFLGDAAHSFPPDVGQGINSAALDVKVLMQVLDEATSNQLIESLLKRYEEMRDDDTSALMRIHRFASPFQYGQSSLGSKLALANVLMRRTITKNLPGVFHPAMRDLISKDLSYREIVRRADATTTRLLTVVISLFLIPFLGIIASRMSQ